MSNILLVNDIPCYTKVAIGAMNPLLSFHGHQVFSLPTALVSNTLDYGKFKIQPMLEFMQDTYQVWQELGFEFDCLCSGFIVDDAQRQWIQQLFETSKAFKVVDPIMADHGKLYNGVSATIVASMTELCKCANLVTPNYTEACFISGRTEVQSTCSKDEARQIVHDLQNIGCESIVVTSIPLTNSNQYCVAGYCAQTQQHFMIEYELVTGHVAGTGDIFSAILVCGKLAGQTLEKSALKAMNFIRQIILEKSHQQLNSKGIIIEQYLHLLKEEVQ